MPSGLIVRKKATQSLTFVYMHTHTHTHKCLFVFRYTLPAQLIYYTFVCQKLIELMTSAIDLCGTQMSMYDTHIRRHTHRFNQKARAHAKPLPLSYCFLSVLLATAAVDATAGLRA